MNEDVLTSEEQDQLLDLIVICGREWGAHRILQICPEFAVSMWGIDDDDDFDDDDMNDARKDMWIKPSKDYGLADASSLLHKPGPWNSIIRSAIAHIELSISPETDLSDLKRFLTHSRIEKYQEMWRKSVQEYRELESKRSEEDKKRFYKDLFKRRN